MIAGDVLSWKDFTFSDGGTAPKKLVVILNQQRNGVHVAVVTTSVEKPPYREKRQGCQVDREYYFFPQGRPFNENTWVMLNDYYEFHVDELDEKVNSGIARIILTLSDTDVRALVNCSKRTESVSEYQVWLME